MAFERVEALPAKARKEGPPLSLAAGKIAQSWRVGEHLYEQVSYPDGRMFTYRWYDPTASDEGL